MEKDGEDKLDHSCRKCRGIHTIKQAGNILFTIKKRKADWIGHILRGNCLQKHVIYGKINKRLEVTGRRGRRRK